MKNEIIVGITGASGSIYFKQTIKHLLSFEDVYIYIIATDTAKQVFNFEMDETFDEFLSTIDSQRFELCKIDDMFNYVASGSSEINAMVITPCSMGTIGKIAAGSSDNLLIRAADCMLKERKKLVLSFREAPLNGIHLKNLSLLNDCGAYIYPLVISHYNKPSSLEEAVDHTVFRQNKYILNHLDKSVVWGKKTIK